MPSTAFMNNILFIFAIVMNNIIFSKMTTKERLAKFINYKKFSNREFSIRISASPTYFTTTKSIGSDKLEIIGKVFPELNMDWVITERGTMLHTVVESQDTQKAITSLELAVETQKELLQLKDEKIETLNEAIADLKRELLSKARENDPHSGRSGKKIA
jgi:hypothetical protein